LSGPPLWVVERGHAKAYLFGMKPIFADEPWLAAHVSSALTDSDVFWCETPPTSEFAGHPLLAELGAAGDVPLRERLDATTYRRLEHAAAAVGIDAQGLDPVRPWIAAQIVRHAAYAQLFSGPTMDDTLRDIATRDGKTVRTEFTAEGIIRAFGTLPPDVEAEALRYDLDSIDIGADAMRDGYLRWLDGDLTLDEADAVRVASEHPGFFARLVRERNAAWEPRIDAALREGVPTFIAVGTLHVVGPDNVLSFLHDDVRRIA
jgi:uncharacterized protein